jgi:hypothetical protein
MLLLKHLDPNRPRSINEPQKPTLLRLILVGTASQNISACSVSALRFL